MKNEENSPSQPTFRSLYSSEIETDEEQRLTVTFENLAEKFASYLLVSLIVALVLKEDIIAVQFAQMIGIGGGEAGASTAWIIFLVPLLQVILCGTLFRSILSHLPQLSELSDDETERIKRRARTVLAPFVALIGVVFVFAFLIFAPEFPAVSDYERGFFASSYEIDSEYYFYERLYTLWGITLYSTAGVTGFLTGMFYNFKLRSAAFLGLLFTLFSMLLSSQTVAFFL